MGSRLLRFGGYGFYLYIVWDLRLMFDWLVLRNLDCEAAYMEAEQFVRKVIFHPHKGNCGYSS